VKHKFPQDPVLSTSHICTGGIPGLSEDLRRSTDLLHSMQVPFDGDPPPVMDDSEQDEEVDWDDDPSPTFEWVPDSRLNVPATDVKIIAFDLFGTIFVSGRPLPSPLSETAFGRIAKQLFRKP